MRIAFDAFDKDTGPRMWMQHGHDLAVMLRPGSFDAGPRRSEMVKLKCYTAQIILCRRNVDCWVRTDELHVLYIAVSDAALTAAGDTVSGIVELRKVDDLKDTRVRALVAAVNAKRLAEFSSAAVSGLHRAGARGGTGPQLWSPSAISTNIPRRTKSRTPATG